MPNIRKPNIVHQLAGTYRPDRHGSALEIKDPLPPPPAWLDAIAKSEYNRVVALSQKYKTLTAADSVALCAYCHLYSQFQRETDGFSTGKISNLTRLASELGLTPIGRYKLKTDAPKEEASKNEFDDV